MIITTTARIGRGKEVGILCRAELHGNIAARSLSVVNGVPIISVITTKTVRWIGIESLVLGELVGTRNQRRRLG